MSTVSDVRAFSPTYLSTAAIGLFASAYVFYLGFDIIAAASFLFSLICYPGLAMTDRIVFDGKRIRRTGIFWILFRRLTGQPRAIKPKRIVHVETEAVRVLKRGQNVIYKYRTSFFSAEMSFSIASGRGYREFILSVLPMIPDGCLDVRSTEIRDHYRHRSEVAAQALTLQIPRSDVLDVDEIFRDRARSARVEAAAFESTEPEKAEALRRLANQLRTNGRLVQSLEAFRRADRLSPGNGRLMYEFARCLQSLAASRRDARFEKRAVAMLRLAERHSGGDSELLSRLGETYFAAGLWRRAERAFRKAAESESSGYRVFRGLGELALRDGKIAHAINYFARSAEVAKPRPLFKWALAETEYLRRLNDDEEYMELEIGRINLYDTLESIRRTTLRITVFGVSVILIGALAGNYLILDIGWAVCGVSLVACAAASLLSRMFDSRIPFELLEKERDGSG